LIKNSRLDNDEQTSCNNYQWQRFVFLRRILPESSGFSSLQNTVRFFSPPGMPAQRAIYFACDNFFRFFFFCNDCSANNISGFLLDRFSQSFHRIKAFLVQLIDLHTSKYYSGLRGQLNSGFSAHLPRCGLRGHLLGGTQGHCLRGPYSYFQTGHIGHLVLAFLATV